MFSQVGYLLTVTGAGEVANATSGTSSAVIVAVIGVVGLLSQMILKDYLDGRKAKRRAAEHKRHGHDVIDLRAENRFLRSELARLRGDENTHDDDDD